MRTERRVSALAVQAAYALGLAALAVSCRKEPVSESAPAQAAVAAPTASAVPADHLAPDELVEGTRQAFGIVLPRVVQVDGTFHDVVFASGRASVHPLVKYFRARVTDGSLREGEEAATFEHVHVPGSKDLDLTVHIRASGASASLEFRDTTPKSLPVLPDDAARWRRAGLTPEGRLLDPAHLE
jgi:hypothetical protein